MTQAFASKVEGVGSRVWGLGFKHIVVGGLG
jgi:hypothetical protein